MKKNDLLIIFYAIILLILLILGLLRVYEKGKYDGMKIFCDYDIGFDGYSGEYICFNESDNVFKGYGGIDINGIEI